MAIKSKEKDYSFKEMPHSIESEMALLGCILVDAKIQIEIAGNIVEEDFYSENHQLIFHAMQKIIYDNNTVDVVTLTDILEKDGVLEKVGGLDYIMELTNILPSSANYLSYLDIVKRDAVLRRLMQGSAKIIENCIKSTNQDEALGFAEKTIYDVSQGADTGDMVKVDRILPDVIGKLDELSKDKSASKGIKTKYWGLDRILNGLHKSDLIVLAARPSVGKTSFAMNLVENVASQGYSCAVFSLEMSKEQLTQRLLCSVANVSMENASRGQLDKTEWLKIAKARNVLSDMKIFINESPLSTPQEILSQCRRLARRSQLDFIMIDYIQLMSAGRSRGLDNRQQEISEISRGLKIMAKELNVPVLALSQLSRDVEKRKGRPVLSDLRESGAIEQDADIVMFIHRPDRGATEEELAKGKIQKNVAEILIEKHRNGQTGMVKLYFKGECTKFLNISDDGEIEGEENVKVDNNVSIDGVEDLPETKPKDEGPSSDEEIFN